MKTNNKTRLLIILAGLLISIGSFSQNDSYIKGRWTINANVDPISELFESYNWLYPEYKLSVQYGVHNILEVGGYTGSQKYHYFNDQDSVYGTSRKFLYGISAKAHLLPLVVKGKDFRFDLYVNTRTGFDYYSSKIISDAKRQYFRFQGGAGLAFYPFRRLGAYAEFGYDNHGILDATDHWSWEFGVVYKFRRKR